MPTTAVAAPADVPLASTRWRLSILNRVTGCALSVGLLLLVYWLMPRRERRRGYAERTLVLSHPLLQAAARRLLVRVLLSPGERHPAPGLGHRHGLERKPVAERARWFVGVSSVRADARAARLLVMLADGARMSLRSPLGRVLGLGSAKEGVASLVGRSALTSVALVPLGAVVRGLAARACRLRATRPSSRGSRAGSDAVLLLLLIAHAGLALAARRAGRRRGLRARPRR